MRVKLPGYMLSGFLKFLCFSNSAIVMLDFTTDVECCLISNMNYIITENFINEFPYTTTKYISFETI
jgi:hypothetical protein